MSVAACFLSLFIFQMNAFLPLNEPYRETLYRGSDIINCLFVVAGIYFALKFAETNRGSQAALAGLSLGLSYLTRPEGVLLFLAAFCLLFLLSFVVSTKISKTKLLWFALAYIIVSMPYVAYLRSVTGRWTLSGKIGAARSYRAELLNVIQRNDWEAFKRNHYSLNKNRLEMNDWYFGYYPKDPLGEEQASSAKGSELLENIRLYPIVPKVLFPPYLFFVGLMGIGYSVYAAIKKRALNDLILFAVFPYSVLVAALSYPIPRHHLFLVPFVCYFGLAGLEGIRCRLRSLSPIIGRTVTVGIWVLIIVSTGNEYLLKFQEYRHSKPRVEASFLFESEIGSYLHNRNAGVVMSTYPSIAIRVGSDWQVMPLGAIDDVFAFAKKKRVDYIVSMDRQTKRNIIIDMGRSAPRRRGRRRLWPEHYGETSGLRCRQN